MVVGCCALVRRAPDVCPAATRARPARSRAGGEVREKPQDPCGFPRPRVKHADGPRGPSCPRGRRRSMIGGMRVRTLAPLVLAALTAASLLAPEAALAHGLVGVGGLPIPRWMFAWAAAIVLVASFAGLGMLWSSPQLQTPRERVVARLPRALDVLLGAAALAWFGVVVYAGLAGEQADPAANLAPTSIFILLWVGVPVASAVFGDVFRPLNPWRAMARLVAWLVPDARRDTVPYPERLGRWPAAIGIACFGWLE